MSDQALRQLERDYAANTTEENREALLRVRVRAGTCPALGTFLTWRHPASHRVHLARFSRNQPDQHTGLNSPLLCRADTIAGRPDRVGGQRLETRMTLWPLNLVWRKQAAVSCRICVSAAKPFCAVPDPAIQPPEPRRWVALLARHQANYWSRWHAAQLDK